MLERGVKSDTCIFFLFDCEDIDAVYSEWKKSYFKYINFEILLDGQVYMSGREFVCEP